MSGVRVSQGGLGRRRVRDVSGAGPGVLRELRQAASVLMAHEDLLYPSAVEVAASVWDQVSAELARRPGGDADAGELG